MTRRVVCGLWPDCDLCMYENRDWILMLTPPPPSLTHTTTTPPPPPIIHHEGTEHVANKLIYHRVAQVANNSGAVMQDSLSNQSNYSPAAAAVCSDIICICSLGARL